MIQKILRSRVNTPKGRRIKRMSFVWGGFVESDFICNFEN